MSMKKNNILGVIIIIITILFLSVVGIAQSTLELAKTS